MVWEWKMPKERREREREKWIGLWKHNLNPIAPIVCLLGQRQLSSIVISAKPKIISLYETHYNAINYHNEIKNHRHFEWMCSKGLMQDKPDSLDLCAVLDRLFYFFGLLFSYLFVLLMLKSKMWMNQTNTYLRIYCRLLFGVWCSWWTPQCRCEMHSLHGWCTYHKFSIS